MPPSSTMTESRFLQLPTEIRENVYRHSFIGAKACINPRLSDHWSALFYGSDNQCHEDTRCYSQVFLVCKQIYHEAQPIQASLIHLDFNYASSVRYISPEWQAKYLVGVKQVTVDFSCMKFDHKDFPSLELLKVATTPWDGLYMECHINSEDSAKNFIAGEYDEDLARAAWKRGLQVEAARWIKRACEDPQRSFKMVSEFHVFELNLKKSSGEITTDISRVLIYLEMSAWLATNTPPHPGTRL